MVRGLCLPAKFSTQCLGSYKGRWLEVTDCSRKHGRNINEWWTSGKVYWWKVLLSLSLFIGPDSWHGHHIEHGNEGRQWNESLEMTFSTFKHLHLDYLPRGVPALALWEGGKKDLQTWLHHVAGCRRGIPVSTERNLKEGKQEKDQNWSVA